MASPLPPDLYKVLGVSKKADASELKTAYRKLVLKVHPDKVQDPALKAIKQDEFTKVQQAWEVLGDKDKRRHYDAQVELYELKKELGKTKSSPRSNNFEFERPDLKRAYTPKPKSKEKESPKVYSHRPPKSYEDVMYDVPRSSEPRRTASYETKRERPSTREGERDRERDRRKAMAVEEEEKIRQKIRREEEKARKAAEKKKGRDSERREKAYTRNAYVEDDTDDDFRAQSKAAEKKARKDAEAEAAREASRHVRKGSMAPKWEDHMAQAAQYMEAASQRRKPKAEDDFRPSPMKRAQTFAAPTAQFDAKYPLKSSDEESPRRTAARASKKSPTPGKPRDSPKVSSKEKKSRGEPYIVEPPLKTPNLQPQTSAPPFISTKPGRSKTEYPRAEPPPPPPIARAATFQVNDRDRGRKSPKSKKPAEYIEETSSSESDSDVPYPTPRQSRSPPPRRVPEQTRYIIDNGRSVPISKARADVDDEDYARDPSPRARRSTERQDRGPTSSSHPRNAPGSYFPASDIPDPVILNAPRPKMAGREASRTASHRAPYFGEVNYAPKYGPENVVYSAAPEFRRGSDGQAYTYASHRGTRGEGVYA